MVRIDPLSYSAAADAFNAVSTDATNYAIEARGVLSGFGGMAGTDPGGESFSAGYDAMAAAALQTLYDIAVATRGLDRALMATGGTHAQANANAEGIVYDAASVFVLRPVITEACVAPPPTAFGGRPDTMVQGLDSAAVWIWDQILNFIGTLFPDGDPQKLEQAGRAWAGILSDIRSLRTSIQQADNSLLGIESGEVAAITEKVDKFADGLNTFLSNDEGIGQIDDICREYAQTIRDTLEETRQMITQLVIEVIAGAGLSVALSFVTFGAAGVAGAAAITARVTAISVRIGSLVAKCVGVATKLAARLRAIVPGLTRAATKFPKLTKAGIEIVSGTSAAVLAETVQGGDANYLAAFTSGFVGGSITSAITGPFGKAGERFLLQAGANAAGGVGGTVVDLSIRGEAITGSSLTMAAGLGVALSARLPGRRGGGAGAGGGDAGGVRPVDYDGPSGAGDAATGSNVDGNGPRSSYDGPAGQGGDVSGGGGDGGGASSNHGDAPTAIDIEVTPETGGGADAPGNAGGSGSPSNHGEAPVDTDIEVVPETAGSGSGSDAGDAPQAPSTPDEPSGGGRGDQPAGDSTSTSSPRPGADTTPSGDGARNDLLPEQPAPDGDTPIDVDPSTDADGPADADASTDGNASADADGDAPAGAESDAPAGPDADADADAGTQTPDTPPASDDKPSQWSDGGPTHDRYGREYEMRDDGRRTLDGDAADTYRDRAGRLHDEDTHQFLADDNRPNADDIPTERAVKGDPETIDLDGDAQTTHDGLRSERDALQADADAAAKNVDDLVRAAGIDPESLTGRSDEVRETLSDLRRSGEISPRQEAAINRALATERDLLADLRGASERMGDNAAGAVSAGRGETSLIPPGGAGAGQFDHVSITGDPRPTLHIYEAKGGGSSLGYRVVDGVRVQQGTTTYLNDVARVDTRLQDSLDAYVQSPDADPRIVEAIRNGELDVKYELVQARPDGRIDVIEFTIDSDSVDIPGSRGDGGAADSSPTDRGPLGPGGPEGSDAPAADGADGADTLDGSDPAGDRAGGGSTPPAREYTLADGSSHTTRWAPEQLDGMQSARDELSSFVTSRGRTMDDLAQLIDVPTEALSPADRAFLMDARQQITVDSSTVIQKVMPPGESDARLDGTYKYGAGSTSGFVTRVQDVLHFGTAKDVFTGLRLDYQGTTFRNPFEDPLQSIQLIRYQVDPSQLPVTPFDTEMAGPNAVYDAPAPFTGNGFTASGLPHSDGNIVPEFHGPRGTAMELKAEMWELTPTGTYRLIGVLDDHGVWQRVVTTATP